MTGRVTIDGLDVLASFGVYVTDYRGVLSWPALKEFPKYDWPDEDGLEVDLSSPALDTRSFSISFCGSATANMGAFFEHITTGANHTWVFEDLELTKVLRVIDHSSYRGAEMMRDFSLVVAEDDYTIPSFVDPVLSYRTGVEIDEKDFGVFGVRVGDLREQLQKSPAVKINLLTSRTGSGAIYDGQEVFFQAKDLTIPCSARLPKESFLNNWNALLHELTRPNERLLYVDSMGMEYPCYYKEVEVQKLSVGEIITCEFDIVVTLTSFRIGGDEYLLASEDSELIMTEDGEYYINLE